VQLDGDNDVEIVSYLIGNNEFSVSSVDKLKLSFPGYNGVNITKLRVNAKLLADRDDISSYRMDAVITKADSPLHWKTVPFLTDYNADQVNLGVFGFTMEGDITTKFPVCVTDEKANTCGEAVMLTIRVNVRATKVKLSSTKISPTGGVEFPAEPNAALEFNIKNHSFIQLNRKDLLHIGMKPGKRGTLYWQLMTDDLSLAHEGSNIYDDDPLKLDSVYVP